MINSLSLSKREVSILLGCLNDASGYPFQEYEPGVKGKAEDFVELFDKVHKNEKLDLKDLSLALLSLRQTFRHMDQETLYALQDDVTLDEVGAMIKRLDVV